MTRGTHRKGKAGADAQRAGERAPDPGWPRHAHGRADAAVLAPRGSVGGACRGAHEGGTAAGRGPGAVPGPRGRLGPDTGVVPPSAGEPAVRHPGAAGVALPVPRLALRRDGQVLGDAGGGPREHVQGPRTGHGVPGAGAERAHLRLPGAGTGAAAAPVGPLYVREQLPAHRPYDCPVQLGTVHGELGGPRAHGMAARAPLPVRDGEGGYAGVRELSAEAPREDRVRRLRARDHQAAGGRGPDGGARELAGGASAGVPQHPSGDAGGQRPLLPVPGAHGRHAHLPRVVQRLPDALGGAGPQAGAHPPLRGAP